MATTGALSRRDFLKSTGSLVVAFNLFDPLSLFGQGLQGGTPISNAGGLFVASQAGQGCTQIGMDGGCLGVNLQELTVPFDGSLEIARLLLLHRILD